jgi:hypothetical protein
MRHQMFRNLSEALIWLERSLFRDYKSVVIPRNHILISHFKGYVNTDGIQF